MKHIKLFEEFRHINFSGTDKDKKEPFFNKHKKDYKNEKERKDRRKLLKECGIDDIEYYDKLINKLSNFGLSITTPEIIDYFGYLNKNNQYT